MNTLQLGRFGGGNAGVALDLRVRAVLARGCVGTQPEELGAGLTALSQHAVEVWRKATRDPASYTVSIDAPPAHVGFGSSAAIQNAVLAGLNWLNGVPLSERALIRLLGSNYAEVDGATLRLAYSTGLSSYLNLYGGFGSVDTRGRLRAHIGNVEWGWLAALLPHLNKSYSGEQEVSFVSASGRPADKDARMKAFLFRDLENAVRRRSIIDFGAAVHSLQRVGSKAAEIAAFGEAVADVLSHFEKHAPCVFMTATGPTVIVLSDTPMDELYALATQAGVNIIASGRIDTVGLSIRTTKCTRSDNATTVV